MKRLDKFIKDRYWFGWWYATICSRHYYRDPECPLCKCGSWTRESHKKLFGKIRTGDNLKLF